MCTHQIEPRHVSFKIKAAESDLCSCEESSQTFRHVFLQCPLYIDLCETLINDIAGIRRLRGKAAGYNTIISHPQAIRYFTELIRNRQAY